MRTRGVIWLVVTGVALLAASSASAATITVNTTSDPGPTGTTSLRQAITAATAGNIVSVPAGHYTLKLGQITIAQPITVAGAGSSSTIIDGNHQSRVFLAMPGPSDVTIQNVTITGGSLTTTSGDDGGGGVSLVGNHLTLSGDVFTGNHLTAGAHSANGGGAVFNGGGGIAIVSSSFLNNNVTISSGSQAGGGGAIFDDGGGITMAGSTVSGNSATISGEGSHAGGGAYFENGGGLTATNSAFTNNSVNVGSTSGNVGGGALFDGGGGITLTNASVTGSNATVTGSATSVGGGGVFDDGGGETWVNVTLSDNSASVPSGVNAGGGGLFLDGGPGKLTNTTIGDNSSNQNSGAVFNVNAGATFKSSLVSGNNAANGHDCDTSGAPFTSLGNNLEDHTPSCGLTGAGDLVGLNPHLAPLAYNGGPGLTNALEAGSPAIDHIPVAQCTDQQSTPQPVATDERGVRRGLDGFCDIGAYETAPADLRLTASAAPAAIVAGKKSTVTFTISNGGPAPATNTKLALSLPKGLKLLSVTPGQIGTVTTAGTHVTVTVQGTMAGKRALSGTVSASEHDPTPANNTASASITVSRLKVSKLKVKHKRVSFKLNAAASVKFTLERCTGHHCKKVKTFQAKGRAGGNHVRLKHLKAGRYKLIAVPVLAGVKGAKATASFRIL